MSRKKTLLTVLIVVIAIYLSTQKSTEGDQQIDQ